MFEVFLFTCFLIVLAIDIFLVFLVFENSPGKGYTHAAELEGSPFRMTKKNHLILSLLGMPPYCIIYNSHP